MPLEDSVNEVFRKIGRNMMLFQELELLLKLIVANIGSISGYADELSLKREQRAANIQKQTMGQLVGQYLKFTDPEYQDFSDAPENPEKAYSSISFHIGDTAYFETKRDALAQMVSDRNELVHHLLPKFDPDSIESCIQIEKQLDEQGKKILCEINKLKQDMDHLQKSKKLFAEFFNSPVGRKELERIVSSMKRMYLINLLSNIAEQTAKSDGWTPIDEAGHLIRQRVPQEIASLKEHFGYKSLKAFILTVKIFDVYEKPAKNGIKILYRKKSDSDL